MGEDEDRLPGLSGGVGEEYARLLDRARGYCAQREVWVVDLRDRLRRWGAGGSDAERIIASLQSERYIDEERYARAYVRSYTKYNGWGPRKIRHGLQGKGVSDAVIRVALERAAEEGVTLDVESLLARRLTSIPSDLPIQRKRERLLRFAASRGIEPEEAFSVTDRLLSE